VEIKKRRKRAEKKKEKYLGVFNKNFLSTLKV
jgi:hypothetical protein